MEVFDAVLDNLDEKEVLDAGLETFHDVPETLDEMEVLDADLETFHDVPEEVAGDGNQNVPLRI